ncbi:MAG: hypothetical protein ACREF3_01595 [Acetobacteraceae bacterium]
MRNSTLTPPTFAEWLVAKGPGRNASPKWGDDDFEFPLAVASPADHERLARLANEILKAAIKLAAVLEAAQRPDRRSCGNPHLQQTGVYADE